MRVSKIISDLILMAIVLQQSADVNAIDTLYIVSGIYDIGGFRSDNSGL